MNMSQQQRAIVLVILVYLVGILSIGLNILSEQVLRLTPFNLLFSAGMLLAFHQKWNSAFIGFLGLAFITGFGVEVLGVHTGLIFGDYHYGATLGWHLAKVPLIIGANWFLLVYASGSLVDRWFKPLWLKVIVGATLMTGLDFLIEPVAMRLDFWDWKNGIVPVQNYVAWWGVSALLHLAFHRLPFPKKNKLAFTLFGMQITFFVVLNFVL